MKFYSIFKVFTLIFTAIIILALPSHAEVLPSFTSFITAQASESTPGSTPEDQFDCSDKIYVVIEVTAPLHQATSKHDLEVKWYNPGNHIEQKTEYEFKSYGKGSRVWAWLRLSGPTGGGAVAQIFDPAFGMGKFIGKWRAVILIDGDKLATHEFDVLC